MADYRQYRREEKESRERGGRRVTGATAVHISKTTHQNHQMVKNKWF
jgi:hypothetical protein